MAFKPPLQLRYALVDDETPARENIRLILRQLKPDMTCMGEAASLQEGLDLFRKVEIDLLFLDVQLGDGNGFELLERLGQRNFAVIFVTAFEEHSIQAIRHAALDYLLKPIDPLLLEQALDRLSQAAPQAKQLAAAKFNYDHARMSRLMLPTQEGFLVIQTEEIVRCEADGNYTRFYLTGSKTILSSQPLAHFDDLLSPLTFTRIHNKHLVNLAFVIRYHKGRGGYLELRDGAQVEVSARKREDFLAAMQRFAMGGNTNPRSQG